MIRPITHDDVETVVAIAVEAGLFSEDESAFLDKMLSDYFDHSKDDGHTCIIIEEAGEGLGVAYYEPARATDRTWYLTMIGVRPDRQGRGYGSELLKYVEQALQTDGQRILLVETLGIAEFAQTRAFYKKCGYTKEAQVRDYYAVGDDMVLFRKDLNSV